MIEAIGAADHKAAAKNLRALIPANAKNLSREQVRAFDDEVKQLIPGEVSRYGTGVDFGDVVRGLICWSENIEADRGAVRDSGSMPCVWTAWPGDLLPGYLVLDGARPLLSAHRWFVSRGIPVLGPFVFRRLCLPVAWRLPASDDAVAVRHP